MLADYLNLLRPAVAGAIASLMLAMTASPAAAVTYATTVTPQFTDPVAAGRGTSNDRHVAANALGAPDGRFFEIGLNGHVDFGFGGVFAGLGTVYEITWGTRDNWQEYAKVEVGMAGDDASFVTVNESPISNQTVANVLTFTGGPFNTVRLSSFSDATRVTKVDRCNHDNTSYDCGGFDVDAIGVDVLSSVAVPLPAPVSLLLASLAGLGLLSRRRAA